MKGLHTYIDGTPSALELEALMELLKELVTTLQASERTADVLTEVMHQLAETDPDTCRWALDNLYDLEAYLELIGKVMKLATQKLIKKGFIPGQDFSANPAGGILIKRNTSNALLKDVSTFDRLIMEDILQVLS